MSKIKNDGLDQYGIVQSLNGIGSAVKGLIRHMKYICNNYHL